MAYGMRLRNNKGKIILDTADVTARVRYSVVETAGNNDSVVLSDIAGKTTELISIGLGTGSDSPSAPYAYAAHSVTRSGTTISWTANSGAQYNSMDSLIIVLLRD